MISVVLSDSGGTRDGWMVMVVRMRGTVWKQTILLEEFFTPCHEMEFWGRGTGHN